MGHAPGNTQGTSTHQGIQGGVQGAGNGLDSFNLPLCVYTNHNGSQHDGKAIAIRNQGESSMDSKH